MLLWYSLPDQGGFILLVVAVTIRRHPIEVYLRIASHLCQLRYWCINKFMHALHERPSFFLKAR